MPYTECIACKLLVHLTLHITWKDILCEDIVAACTSDWLLVINQNTTLYQ